MRVKRLMLLTQIHFGIFPYGQIRAVMFDAGSIIAAFQNAGAEGCRDAGFVDA